MSVFRVNKNQNYTVMSNYHLKDKNLSLKAKGLLSQMLSLPDTWDFTVAGLCAINKESETAINNTLKELKANGYLVVTKKMPNETKSGRLEYVYDIYEMPKQEGEKQPLENQPLENQVLENIVQLNTNDKDKEYKNTNNVYTEKAVELWNSIPSLPNVVKLSEKREKALKSLFKEYIWEQFEKVIENIKDSSFLNGKGGKWACSFDWVLNKGNFLKILEGNYKDRENKEEERWRTSQNLDDWGEGGLIDCRAIRG